MAQKVRSGSTEAAIKLNSVFMTKDQKNARGLKESTPGKFNNLNETIFCQKQLNRNFTKITARNHVIIRTHIFFKSMT